MKKTILALSCLGLVAVVGCCFVLPRTVAAVGPGEGIFEKRVWIGPATSYQLILSAVNPDGTFRGNSGVFWGSEVLTNPHIDALSNVSGLHRIYIGTGDNGYGWVELQGNLRLGTATNTGKLCLNGEGTGDCISSWSQLSGTGIQGISAGTGISVTNPNGPTATVSNTGVLSVTGSSQVSGDLTFTGAGVSQSGKTFTFSGGGSLPSGNSGDTLRYNGGWVANNVLYNNGTNVGIGTTGPLAKLDVNAGTQDTQDAVTGRISSSVKSAIYGENNNGWAGYFNNKLFAPTICLGTTSNCLNNWPAGGGVASVSGSFPIAITGTATNPIVGLTTTCSSTQILKWNGSAWACAADATGSYTDTDTLDIVTGRGNKTNNQIILGQGTGLGTGVAYVDVNTGVQSTYDAISSKISSATKSALYAEQANASGWAGYFSGPTIVAKQGTNDSKFCLNGSAAGDCITHWSDISGTGIQTVAAGTGINVTNPNGPIATVNNTGVLSVTKDTAATGALTFTGAGVSQTGTTFTFSGGGTSLWLGSAGSTIYPDQYATTKVAVGQNAIADSTSFSVKNNSANAAIYGEQNGTGWAGYFSGNLYAGGNVGIGTTTPGAKLEVAGQIKITGGTPAAGKVLTSLDATGLATWQPPAAGGVASVAGSFPIAITGTATNPIVGLTTTCSSTQILKWNGSAWACAADATGSYTDTDTLDIVTGRGNKTNNHLVLGQGTGSSNGVAFVDVDAGTSTTYDAISSKINSATKSAIYGQQSNASGWAGYFSGNTIIDNTAHTAQTCLNGSTGTDCLNGWTNTTYGTQITGNKIGLLNTCTSTQILKWNGSAWACAADATGSSTDEKVKVSSNDTTAGYLNGKLVAGANITLTENNDGANETYTIASSGGTNLWTDQGTYIFPNNVTTNDFQIMDTTGRMNLKNNARIEWRQADGSLDGGFIGVWTDNKLYLGTGDFDNSYGYITVDGSGNLGVGNGSQYANLQVMGNAYVSSNLGVGTLSPGAKLEVAGQVKITGGAPGVGKVLTSSDANGLATWQTISTLPAGASGQTLRHDGTNWVANNTLYNDGTNIGIGTTGPAIKLAVGDSDTGLQWLSDGQLDIYSNNVSSLSARSGNIGIGTTTPTEKLQVAGNILASGSLTAAQLKIGQDDPHRITTTQTPNGAIDISAAGTGWIGLNYGSGTGGTKFYNGTTTQVAEVTSAGNLNISGDLTVAAGKGITLNGRKKSLWQAQVCYVASDNCIGTFLGSKNLDNANKQNARFIYFDGAIREAAAFGNCPTGYTPYTYELDGGTNYSGLNCTGTQYSPGGPLYGTERDQVYCVSNTDAPGSTQSFYSTASGCINVVHDYNYPIIAASYNSLYFVVR